MGVMHAAPRATCMRSADAVKLVRAFYTDAIHSQIKVLRWRGAGVAASGSAGVTNDVYRRGCTAAC